MKVLWITNILFPEASALLSHNNELKATGGWMLGAARALVENEDIQLSVASCSKLVDKLTKLDGERITYYILPMSKSGIHKKSSTHNNINGKFWSEVNNAVNPDVVHIHGTESPLGISYVNCCEVKNVVVSIQGMHSVYYHYYYSGLSMQDVRRNASLKDFLSGNSILKGQAYQKLCSSYEISLLKKVKHVIGRTNWDKSHVWAINPDAEYHFCNETLREEFYTGQWAYEKCIPHSIFVSQANYPIKGIHQLFKALPLVLRRFPDTLVKIGGFDVTKGGNGLIQKMKEPTYPRILKKLISDFNLEKHVIFLGPLSAEEMKAQYLKANVFVSPSTIENSPNSLGEAQILGVPCVSSYVGGVSDMIPNQNCGTMYRFEEVEMLAYDINEVFLKSSSWDCSTEREVAYNRHNPKINAKTLENIYYKIMTQDK